MHLLVRNDHSLKELSTLDDLSATEGSYIGTCVPSRDLLRYMSLYEQGRLPVDRLLSGKLELDDINAGFDTLADGIAVRQVITLG